MSSIQCARSLNAFRMQQISHFWKQISVGKCPKPPYMSMDIAPVTPNCLILAISYPQNGCVRGGGDVQEVKTPTSLLAIYLF